MKRQPDTDDDRHDQARHEEKLHQKRRTGRLYRRQAVIGIERSLRGLCHGACVGEKSEWIEAA